MSCSRLEIIPKTAVKRQQAVAMRQAGRGGWQAVIPRAAGFELPADGEPGADGHIGGAIVQPRAGIDVELQMIGVQPGKAGVDGV